MEALIKEKLKEIELRGNCRIFLAVESGSRAWGFSSTIVYKTTDFAEAFKPVMLRCFSSQSGLWPYLHRASDDSHSTLQRLHGLPISGNQRSSQRRVQMNA